METTAIALTVLRQAETYIFSLDLPNQSYHALRASDTHQAPASWSVGGMTTLNADVRGQLNETINAAVERLRRSLVGSRKKRETSASLLRLGQFLFNFLLPPALQDALRDLPEQNMPLILTTNDTELPWELLHDGTEYLTLKHPIARRLWSPTPLRPKPMPSSSSRSFLLITNPTEDLPEADNESDDLMDLFERELISGASLKVLARHRANWLRVSQALGGNVDIIHYSGHAERGVLLLHDGELTTSDISKTLQGHPFVFLNACWSSREAKQVKSAEVLDYAGVTIRNMAQAFILAGSAGFIGTLWPVFDQSSRRFAERFYTYVLDGVPVGEALRRTREQMREQEPDDPVWASFVHYGNPQLTLAKAPPKKRYVTVLVAQLTGVELLFEALTLETAAEMKEEVLARLKGIVGRYGGSLHGPVTDLFSVYFGIGIMTGNEAEVAIRAARDMTQALRDFEKSKRESLRTLGKHKRLPEPHLRIGISTGYVLYRPSQVDGTDGQIMGQLENVAAVGMAQAKPGQIIVDQATYQSARSTFSFESLEAAVSPLYRVIGHNLPTRSEFVGRSEELGQLQGFWRKAKKGRRQIISIVGEPGVGKTRLLQAFREQITGDRPSPLTPLPTIGEGDHLWVSAICHNYDKSQSYSLLAQLIRALAQLETHDDEATQRRKLGQLIEREDDLALLSNVLGLPFDMPAIQNLSQDLAQKLLKNLMEKILKSKSARQPIVLALEDLQSADQDSLTVLEQVVTGSKRMRLLLLAVYRPSEWRHNWGDRVQANILLEELPSDAQLTMLTNLLGLEPSEEVAEALLKQTGGHPLFIEEYVRFLQESGVLSASGTASLPDIPLLASRNVEAVIQARLGRLDDESRQALHSAAIIGQKFEEQVLYEVQEKRTHQPPDEQEIIDALTHRRLIEEWEEEWDSDTESEEDSQWHDLLLFYAFRHGLVHQIASQLFPDSFLQTIHRLVAQALHVVYGDEEKILSRLAYHYYHSRDRVKAIRYGLRVAERDAQKWANQGALLWYGRALEKIQSFSEQPPNESEQREVTAAQLLTWHLEALERQAEVLGTVGQSDQAITNYEQALTLAGQMPIARRAGLYRKLAVLYDNKGQFEPAKEALNKGLQALSGLICLEAGRIHVFMGLLHYRKGELSAALASCEQGIAIITTISDSESLRDLAQAHNLKGILYRNLALSEQAIAAYGQSIALYKQAQYLPGEEYASYNLGCAYQDLGKWDDAQHCFQQSSTLSQRMGKEWRQAAALNNQGEIYRRQGKLEQAILACQQAQQIWQESGFEEFVGVAKINLGASYLKKGALTEAKSYLTESLSLFQRLEANLHLPENLRYLAELEVLNEQAPEARQLAQEAVDWALKLERRVEEGPARRALGQALRALGLPWEAQKQLDESLSILEENNNPYEIGLTLLELALLRQAQHKAEDHDAWREQAIAYCERAITIFNQLGAAHDLARTQQIHQSL